MKVELIKKNQVPADSQRLAKDNRPPNIDVSKKSSIGHRWRECKIIGKNVSIRSYGAGCAFKNKLYLYGGYQILHGALKDFYSISLEQSQIAFNWEQILSKGDIHPGNRSKHALVSTNSHIYLIGGFLINNTASNDIYCFHPENQTWSSLKPEGVRLPPLQSFGAVAIKQGEQDKIVIAFGFNEDVMGPSNRVYEYHVQKNKISILHEGSQQATKDIPKPRTGSAITTDGKDIYAFGGKTEAQRLNDLWKFSLTDFKWNRLNDQGQLPTVRNGHSLNYYNGNLYLFGGIHDITWELDDLHIYNLNSHKWTTLEHDSPRKLQKKTPHLAEHQRHQKHEKNQKKKNFYENLSSAHRGSSPMSHHNRAASPLSISKYNFSHTFGEEINKGESNPGRMLQQQKKKQFMHKKAEMLKNFQVPAQEKARYLALQTSSQAMKISLDVIGNPDPKVKIPEDKLTDFGKQSESKFLGPLQNNSNIVVDKKPCARDGHSTVILGSNLVIFGGDRHQMSFNDIYKLDLTISKKE